MAAAAASTFAGAGSAEAEIHYSGDVFIILTGNAQATLPLSSGAYLVFQNIDPGTTFWQDLDFLIKGAISGSARDDFTTFYRAFLSNLPSRENVSAGKFSSVAANPNRGVLISNFSDGDFGPIDEGPRGFIGFRFNTGKGTQYGWARIKVNIDTHFRIHAAIKDYAWGDVGDAILTGQKQSLQGANAKSIAGSLGLLAFGAQGLDAWRAPRTQKSN